MLGYALSGPAGGVSAITGALVLLAFAWIALYGLKYGYDYSLGALLRKLADSTRGIRWVGGKLAGVFEEIDSFVESRIADGINSVESAAARLWDGLAWLVRETGDALVAFGADVHDAIDGIVRGEIPTQVRAGTAQIDTRLDGVNRRQNAQARAEALARSRGIDAVNRDLTREELARQRGIDAVQRRITELVMPRIRALDQTIADVVGFTRRNLAIRMRHVEQALAAGAIGAIALAAVTRVFPYWQCTNVRRFNRALCRLPIGLLDDLLGVGLAVLVMADVCRLASLMRRAAVASLPALRGLVAVVDAATHCTTFPKPPALPIAATELPASENLVALAGWPALEGPATALPAIVGPATA
jgi:hypothetical protein